jgi:hypothetical protein
MFDESSIKIYSDRDKLRTQIIEYAKDYLEMDNIDLSYSSYLSYLINIISAMTSNLLYYNASVSREFFITKAIQKESVLNLASMLGYSPPFATTAQAQIMVAISIDFSDDVSISIPSGFKYYTADNTVFTQNNSVQIDITNPNDPNSLIIRVQEIEEVGTGTNLVKNIPYRLNDNKNIVYFSVTASQEEFETLEFSIPSLEPYEFHHVDLTFTGSLSSLAVVTFQDSPESTEDIWTKYDSLFLVPSGVKGFAYRTTGSGGRISFGNGVIGVQPKSNYQCKVTIGKTLGAKGNVIAGSIVKTDKLYVSDNSINKPIKLRVINTAPVTGGTDAPTIDDIRAAALANVSSSKRLVTMEDYRNMKYIVEDFPVNTSIEVMKRSDIKTNEISLFTELIYDDSVVPMRNTRLVLDSSNLTYVSAYEEVTIDGEEYKTLFDMEIDLANKECKYIYLLDEAEITASLLSSGVSSLKVLPVYAKFTITRSNTPNDDYVTIDFYYQIVNDDGSVDYSIAECKITNDWDYETKDMVHHYSSGSTLNYFSTTYLVQEIGYGERVLTFSLQSPTPVTVYFTATVNAIIKRDLSDFMYSAVKTSADAPYYQNCVYDVPVIQKAYYDTIDQVHFNDQILYKIISFDVTQYRMLTDFINLKFANSTGYLRNMYYNERRFTVKSTDPITLPVTPADGDKYLVTGALNVFGFDPICVAEWQAISSSWIRNGLYVNDLIYDDDELKLYIFTGDNVVEPLMSIPFNIHAVVWRQSGSSITSNTLSQRIKDELISELYSKFGYDKPIYRSEIISTIQSVTGVDHCELLSPPHDIFFEYDVYEDLTQQELLEYTPELVYFDTSTIVLDIK